MDEEDVEHLATYMPWNITQPFSGEMDEEDVEHLATYMPWNITQPFSGAKLGHLWRRGWTQSLSHRVKSESESESCSVVSNSLQSHGL